MTPSIPALPSWHHFKPLLGWLCCLFLIFALRAKIGPETQRGAAFHSSSPAVVAPAPGSAHLPVVHLVDPATAPRDGITPAIGN